MGGAFVSQNRHYMWWHYGVYSWRECISSSLVKQWLKVRIKLRTISYHLADGPEIIFTSRKVSLWTLTIANDKCVFFPGLSIVCHYVVRVSPFSYALFSLVLNSFSHRKAWIKEKIEENSRFLNFSLYRSRYFCSRATISFACHFVWNRLLSASSAFSSCIRIPLTQFCKVRWESVVTDLRYEVINNMKLVHFVLKLKMVFFPFRMVKKKYKIPKCLAWKMVNF